jgi:biopolymer transport protein ExbD
MSAEVSESSSKDKKGKGSKQKKMSVRVDFTPMVDMNMLLITFFMLCTSLSRPQTMEIVMPRDDKDLANDKKSEVKASEAITLLLAGDNKMYYYDGLPDYTNYNSLKETTYGADGLRGILLKRNVNAVKKAKDLKAKKDHMPKEDYERELSEIRTAKGTPVVIIKATDESKYVNLISALDEMQICNIGKYVITAIEDADKALIKNFETKGALSQIITE